MKDDKKPGLNKYKPDPRECALLFLRLVEEKEGRRPKPMTRALVSELTLQRLWKRQRLAEQPFLEDVREWLLTAGWALFFTGAAYGAVKASAVRNWPTLASKRIAAELALVGAGKFDFATLDHLLEDADDADAEDDSSEPNETSED